MAGILLWLAEVVGGVALKSWLQRTFGWAGAKDVAKTQAEASRAEAEVQAQAQVIKAEKAREKVDANVAGGTVADQRNELRDDWTRKD